jgi:ABC-2 type transport system permease protein
VAQGVPSALAETVRVLEMTPLGAAWAIPGAAVSGSAAAAVVVACSLVIALGASGSCSCGCC